MENITVQNEKMKKTKEPMKNTLHITLATIMKLLVWITGLLLEKRISEKGIIYS